MALPEPVVRRHVNTRAVTYRGYRREDGLWDIEAHLSDSKPFAFSVPGELSRQANEPVHDLHIRLTIDGDFLVHDVAVVMARIPHARCPQAEPPMQRLVGHRLNRGWRRSIEDAMGGTDGCTHLRELLFNMATAAFQSMPDVFAGHDPSVKPPHLDRCITWDTRSELVQQLFPLHYQPRAAASTD